MDEKGYRSLLDYYQQILDQSPASSGTTNTVSKLFSDNESQKYINKAFQVERKNEQIRNCLDKITPFRARHTVSAYLLGRTIRDYLEINTRSWRRLPGDKSPVGSFNLFWSWICLFHDIGYRIEESSQHSSEYFSCNTIELLRDKLGIKHDFLSVSSNPELIRKYYRKRFDGHYIDHGIVGALYLYDALMKLSSEGESRYAEIKEYSAFYASICDTIAVHNMWRATDITKAEYEAWDLYELIPDVDNHHMIYYKDNPFLFLLGLVDTIDPIKFFCRDKKYKNPITPMDVLTNYNIKFINYSGHKSILIQYESDLFDSYVSSLCDSKEGLPSWLGVTTIKKENALLISIDLTTQQTPEVDAPEVDLSIEE